MSVDRPAVAAVNGQQGAGLLDALEISPAPTMITRLSDGVIVMANAAALAVVGWTREELVGRVSTETIWTRPGRRVDLLQRVGSGERLTSVEFRLRTKSGEIRHIIASLDPITVGTEPCLLGVFHDITERKRAELVVTESEKRLRRLVERLHVGVVLRDLNPSICAHISPAVEHITGFSADEFYRDPDLGLSIVHPDDRQRLTDLVRELVLSGKTSQFEGRIVRKDGTVREIVMSTVPLVSEDDNEVIRLASWLEDVTERKAAERALRESEARFRQLVDNIDVAFTLRSVEPIEVLYASPAFERIFGLPVELIASDVNAADQLVHPDDLPRIIAHRERVLSGQASEIENRMVRPDGSVRWLRSLSAPVYHQGRMVRLATTVEDITERKEAEEALRLAQAEATRANLAKNEFLSRTSHELRTPMNSILGFGQLLELETLSPTQREAVEHILKAGQHLLGLINEVLDISRIESGQLSLSLEPVAVPAVVNEVTDLMRPLAHERSITMRKHLPPGLPVVKADRQRLSQILLNLVSNAIKYNHEGGCVDIYCEETEPDGVRLSVSDTGPGLTDADMDRIFVPFDRLGAERSDVEGTGVGLALSKALTEAMGGNLELASSPGLGTTFSIVLPTSGSGVEADPASDLSDDDVLSELALDTHGDAKVLCIEDNLANVQVIKRLLDQRPGTALYVATSGQLGVDLARQHRPTLILLDLHLPDLNGEDVLIRLQADPATAAIPVVVLSADATPRTRRRVLSRGAAGYLTKPLHLRELIAVVNAHHSPPSTDSGATDG